MSEMPEQTGPDSPEVHMLNRILDRAMPSVPDPPEEDSSAARGLSQPPDVSRETLETEPSPSPSAQGSKRSSVYVYLAVLFGAAFLMLLLAYFVQQRNNATAMDDLRSTSTASRQELLEDIQKLEEEKEALEKQIAELELDLAQEQSLSQDFQTLYDGARNSASHLQYYLVQRSQAMELLWQLEDAYRQRDYALCQQLVKWMELPESVPRKNYLPTSDDRSQYDYGLDGPTPAERYQEIFDELSTQ